MWLFFQPADERPRPWQGYVKLVDPEEQEEAVARLGVMGTCQRGMLVGTPLVETEQDHRSRRFARSSREQEPSPPGQVATGTA
jgi:DNA-directed RNA polymerase subunit N (RpoN/RPB10)